MMRNSEASKKAIDPTMIVGEKPSFADIAFCRNCYACSIAEKKCLLKDMPVDPDRSTCGMFVERPGELANFVTSIKLDSYFDNVKTFGEMNPFFYNNVGVFWFWNKRGYCWEQKDEVDIMNMLDRQLGFAGQTISARYKHNYLEAFKRVGRLNMPKIPEKHWIQFKEVIYDINTGKTFLATPAYFFTNPIPHKLGESEDTPMIDKLFNEWVLPKNVQTLYEIMAYSLITDYPIHRIFCFHGAGCNGKSQYQRLLMNFIGVNNLCSTELDLLCNGRFESVKLYKKLVCQLGETNLGSLDKTSMLKKLSGQDMIGYEYKGKKPFDDYNYAKIIINTNSLPSTNDDSDGFKRRWLIIQFPNQFKEGNDIISPIPEEEYENLCRKCLRILNELLKRGGFTGEGNIQERRYNYMVVSNPLPIFVGAYCIEAAEAFCRVGNLYIEYINFLRRNKLRIVSRSEFYRSMDELGYERRRTYKYGERDIYFEGVMVNHNLLEKDIKLPKLSHLSQLSL